MLLTLIGMISIMRGGGNLMKMFLLVFLGYAMQLREGVLTAAADGKSVRGLPGDEHPY